MKKLKQGEVRLLFLLLITIIVVCSIRFGYTTNREKAEMLENENIELEEELIQYRAMQQNESLYQEGLVSFKENIEAILNAYGPGTSPEKTTGYITDLENDTGAKIFTISFGTPEIFFSSLNARNEENDSYQASNAQMSLSYRADYEQFKKMVDYIQGYKERITIDSVSIAFDQETGNLTGTLVLNWYALTGTGRVYEDPETDGIAIGKDNIFGSSY